MIQLASMKASSKQIQISNHTIQREIQFGKYLCIHILSYLEKDYDGWEEILILIINLPTKLSWMLGSTSTI